MKDEFPCRKPYGTWPSPISAETVATAGTGSSALPREIRIDGTTVYWIEFRTAEDARYVLMRRSPGGQIECITPAGYSVRSRVHEYGGGAYTVHQKTIYFVNDLNQAIYTQREGAEPALLTQPSTDRRARYADLTISPDGKWLAAVRERHLADSEVVNDLVVVPLQGEWKIIQLASGHDFFAAPRFNPAGDRLCWLSWDHPNMPWDGTVLRTARFEDGALNGEALIAGGPDESIFQPDWSADGKLFFVSDRSGWWNIYCFDGETVSPIAPMEVEFGRPAWLLGFSTYAFTSKEAIAAVYKQDGDQGIGMIDPAAGTMRSVRTGCTSFELPSIAADTSGNVWFLAGNAERPPGLMRLDPANSEVELIRAVGGVAAASGTTSAPEHVAFPSASGRKAYAYFYPARNPDCISPDGDMSPLIVTAHGGPTSCARPHYDPEVQFWTSRGFALLDVDYAGSDGYGRAYRRSLDGQWGVADLQDCIYGARHMVDQGHVAGDRILVRGRSAGGFLTLAALTFSDTFRAGASYFGIGDLMTLANHTHKFEAHYLDRLVGPLPQAEEAYRRRSPLAHLDKLQRPVILFHGLDDAIVPPVLAEEISAALEEKRLPFALLLFAGEGHGFKKQETIIRSLEAELEFYQRVLGLFPADQAPTVDIRNL